MTIKKCLRFIANCLICHFVFVQLNHLAASDESRCYDASNKPQRCSPEFINAAFNRVVTASNTCGSVESQFCVQTNIHSAFLDTNQDSLRYCDICDQRIREKSHPPEYLTDANNQASLTWWQSDTMEDQIQYPNSVNITLRLGKSFDITYVQIKFYSPRPESFAIYKRTNESSEWVPYQYYSSNCEDMYGLPNRGIIQRDREDIALCTDEFSDIAPLTGGSVAFSTLEGRPSAYEFENSPALKEWVTATDILISLNRLNTFGDEVFNDPIVLRSYFYAISDIAVGGRCKCNGHADRCSTFEDNDLEEKYKCECKHNTDGIDCEKCLPFFNDQPWAPATYADANECQPCNCSGLSNKCYFDQELYDATGHGGHCFDCQRNTDGPHCENCKEGFFRREYDNECVDCNCHPLGSQYKQCDPTGKCKCKPGVTGLKCDMCMPNHYGLDVDGCKVCTCNAAGSIDAKDCDHVSGKCRCKANVEGHQCDKCKPGFFNLDANLTAGCLPCFCYGHSSECKSSSNHVAVRLESKFDGDTTDDWSAADEKNEPVTVLPDAMAQGIFIYSSTNDLWFIAPEKYRGNFRNSYNQEISFSIKFGQTHSSRSRKDLVIESESAGLQIYRTIYENVQFDRKSTDNQDRMERTFTFRLNENDGWRPTLSARDFQKILSNVTAIKIKASLGGYTFLKDFKLIAAQLADPLDESVAASNQTAPWIEQCTCPNGHTGQFCENCQVGFRREIPFTDSFTKCVPCSCNGHSTTCDVLSGKCDCLHQTTGDNCENCREGYYGDALNGKPNDCKKCPCPNDGPCAELYNHQSKTIDVVCLSCPVGTTGNLCDICEDGYYKTSEANEDLVCEKCQCNNNVDPNAVGNCVTDGENAGQCLRCIYNTTGAECEKCLPGYWGNAIEDVKCHACECNVYGSDSIDCDLNTGQCSCRSNVIGLRCDKCQEGYWNITSKEGCTECKCNPLGSTSLSCDVYTGKCSCRPGVTGDKCDKCMVNHYGFSSEGCKNCNCDPRGSTNWQCNELGACECAENVAGLKCDRCAENFYNFTFGCMRCDDCYNLVQNKVTKLRGRITVLDDGLNSAKPGVDVEQFNQHAREIEQKLNQLKTDIGELFAKLFPNDELQATYKDSLKNIEEAVQAVSTDLRKNQKLFDLMEKNVTELDSYYSKFDKLIAYAQLKMNQLSLEQQSKAQELESIRNYKEEETDPNMTKLSEIANQGRDLADEHRKIASDFAKSVVKNLENARLLLIEVNDLSAKSSQLKLVNDLDHDEASRIADQLIKHANSSKQAIEASITKFTDGISAVSKVKLDEDAYEKPVNELGEQIAELDKFVTKSKKDVDDLNKQTVELAEKSAVQIDQANVELGIANSKDKDLSVLLERSENARNKTEASLILAKEAFGNASEIVELLENFDAKLEENKENAAKQWNLKPETEENLEKSRNLSAKVNNDLYETRASLEKAAMHSNYAQVDLTRASQGIEFLSNSSTILANNSGQLSTKVGEMEKRYTNLNKSLAGSVEKQKTEKDRISDLYTRASDFVTKSQDLLNSINNAEYELTLIKPQNIYLNGLEMSQIQKLKDDFNKIMVDLDKVTDIDASIQELIEREEQSRRELIIYEREIPQLKLQINQLEKISDLLRNERNCAKSPGALNIS